MISPSVTCPACGHSTGRPSCHGPQPGEWYVCYGCFEPSVFDDDLAPREPTDAELEQLKHPEGQKMLRFLVRSIIKDKRRLIGHAG